MAPVRSKEKSPYLLRINNIHDNTALQHLSETGLDREVVGSRGGPVGTVLLRSHAGTNEETFFECNY